MPYSNLARMKQVRTLSALSAICTVLIACTAKPRTAQDSPPPPPSSSAPADIGRGPSLSLETFRTMELSGTGLDLAVLAEDSASTHYSITYRSNGIRISGLLDIPRGNGPFPLVILNHGYISPSFYSQGHDFLRERDSLARSGFAVLHTDYRGYALSDPDPDADGIYDAVIAYSIDSANAILAVRAAHLPQIDAEHVGMLGHSLGGGVTLNIAVAHPELIDAVVLYAPVNADAWENFSRWPAMRGNENLTREVLGTREENPGVWKALSARSSLENIDDPLLLFHGTADEIIPKAWSDALASDLQSRNKHIVYIEYDGEKHAFTTAWDDFMRRTTEFFRRNLSAQER